MPGCEGGSVAEICSVKGGVTADAGGISFVGIGAGLLGSEFRGLSTSGSTTSISMAMPTR